MIQETHNPKLWRIYIDGERGLDLFDVMEVEGWSADWVVEGPTESISGTIVNETRYGTDASTRFLRGRKRTVGGRRVVYTPHRRRLAHSRWMGWCSQPCSAIGFTSPFQSPAVLRCCLLGFSGSWGS